MILRFIVENFASFKEAVEFNTFPASKSHNHDNHKIECGHASALRMSAIYGANGAGKSNLIYALGTIWQFVRSGSINGFNHITSKFKFDPAYSEKPTGLAVEYYTKGYVFYYHIELSSQEVIVEELLLSMKTKDVELFSRKGNKITINSKFSSTKTNRAFVDGLSRLVRSDMLVLPFLGNYYPIEFPIITDAYNWFIETLILVQPSSSTGVLPQLMDVDNNFSKLVNETMPELKTGIDRLKVKKDVLDERDENLDPSISNAILNAKAQPGIPQIVVEKKSHDILNIVFDVATGQVFIKRIVAIHSQNGVDVEMSLRYESDGTRRLIEYMPLFYSVIQNGGVYVVDEIERSIHPILIKSIISKISASSSAKGQLIFTTHESCLLDQNIFRPDEIWFAQKDSEQATQLYPLSDFNIHHTANIENGYLNGRYGGIPFLSNLKDLHW